jgi:hypothetical protein
MRLNAPTNRYRIAQRTNVLAIAVIGIAVSASHDLSDNTSRQFAAAPATRIEHVDVAPANMNDPASLAHAARFEQVAFDILYCFGYIRYWRLDVQGQTSARRKDARTRAVIDPHQ